MFMHLLGTHGKMEGDRLVVSSDILTEYEGILEQKYYPHPELKTVRMEMGELEAALKDLDLNVVVRGGRVCRKG